MSFITRNILRWGLIGGLALGAACVLFGPAKVKMGLATIRAHAQAVVDSAMDDPMALRRQLERLAEEYPERISEVKGELAEVDHQIGQLEKELAVAERVVAMTTDDLTQLKALVSRAEGEAGARTVSLRFAGVRYDLDEAYAEGRRISAVRTAFQDKQGHGQVQLNFLKEQRGRLSDILGKLEEEYNTYQAQLWQLDREIDAIQRNERLIELTEQQQATLESYERFGHVDNLHQLQAKLAELRTIQQAQLETLEKQGIHRDYEEQARYELQTQDIDDSPFDNVIKRLEEETKSSDEPDESSIAWNEPVVIE